MNNPNSTPEPEAVNSNHSSASKSQRARKSLHVKRNTRRYLGGALTLGVAFTGLTTPAFADGVGGGGVSGGGGSAGPTSGAYLFTFDDADAASTGSPTQGWGQASIDYFGDRLEAWARDGNPQGFQEWADPVADRSGLQAACSAALAEASARGNGARSRVVQVGVTVGETGGATRILGWGGIGSVFTDWYNGITPDGWIGNLKNYGSDAGTWATRIADSFRENISPNPSVVCVALNENEPIVNYTLTVTTDHSSNVPGVAGTKQAVTDTIHASASTGVRENVTANVTLNWSGPESAANHVDKKVTKSKSIANHGDTVSPSFTPSDFGWDSWPSGKFWFDVSVAKQGKMAKAVSLPGVSDARENWNTARDEGVVKKLTSGNPADEVKDSEVFASGMFYNAEITAPANGYSSQLTIQDIIKTDKVFIGATDKDVASAVKLLDPDGKEVSNANVKIDRSSGKVTVSASVKSIPDKFQSRDYKLIVPTYFLPTKADYTVADDSRVCYTVDVDECITGDSKQTRKVTPTPDKVWVLDENGALVAADPDHTNKQGSDEKVFLMNDEVAAVVNGRIPANLAEPFTNYELIDDWTDASKYVDFSDASKAKVFLETAPGSGEYTDVTSNFDITVDGTVTTAKAKEGSQFLRDSKNASSTDRKTKLVISGKFKDDYDTQGELVTLTNAGHEVWNNEEIPTNVPPVYTWTPDPNKQVVGSSDESGDKTYEDIHGLAVFPGQKLEYSVGVDLRVPSNTARGVKTLSVLDQYDPMFTPDKTSVEFWDSRDPLNPRPVSAKNYKLTFDDKTNSFRADFTQEWIDANVNVEGANSEWQTKGWLTMRFTGTVKDEAEHGTTVKNQAFQIINGASTETEIPEVEIPEIEPHKEDLNVDTLEDINGKTVVQGDHLLYRLTLDARLTKEQLAYHVHKLGMVDDFDEEFLDLTEKAITVKHKGTGEDVTDKFNIQVKNGKAYIFAKQVDSVNYYGEEIPGDPQPEDLEAYSTAPIIPHKTPIIDQDLLGHEYYVLLDTVVKKEVDGYNIVNQATQNIQNTWHQTEIVSNPLKDIDPNKDVVVSEETKDNSINKSEVKLFSDFNYRLNSSEIPADRAYAASQWSMKDTFDRTHDEFTGIWAIYANSDVYDGDELVFKKGDLLQDSAGHESEPLTGLFDVNWDEKSYTISVEATDKYLDLINTRGDLAQSFSVYTKMIRIAPGDKIENQVLESYNDVERESNIVWTKTPENPSISVEKYTTSEGFKKGDRDDKKQALELTAVQLGKKDAADKKQNLVDVTFTIVNDGDVPLKDVTFDDQTLKDTFGSVEDIYCEVPLTEDEANSLSGKVLETGPREEVAETEESTDSKEVEADKSEEASEEKSDEKQEKAEVKTKKVAPSEVKTLDVGESVDCVGTLEGVAAGQFHSNEVKVTGKSVFTDKEVSDDDQWHAEAPADPKPGDPADPANDDKDLRGAITGVPVIDNNPWLFAGGLGLLALALGLGGVFLNRHRKNRFAFDVAEENIVDEA